MRKNSPRKFIHAVLDVLPLFVIPIFAININQKSVEPISIDVQEQISVDFNQLVKIPNVDYSRTENNVEIIDNRDGTFNVKTNGNSSANTYIASGTIDAIANHIYVVKGTPININGRGQCYVSGLINTEFDTNGNGVRGTQGTTSTTWPVQLYIFGGVQIEEYLTFTLNVFDLTQMFGSGNEPTLQEFNIMFPNRYYAYTESQKMLVNKPSTTTYNSTDIGSQFLYSLYKPVNDYFNFNNLFNMNDVWSWIQMNLFSGSAPLPVFIVWNIIIYEFFIDLIFLLYSVFMFIIDFADKMLTTFMEKPLRR